MYRYYYILYGTTLLFLCRSSVMITSTKMIDFYDYSNLSVINRAFIACFLIVNLKEDDKRSGRLIEDETYM